MNQLDWVTECPDIWLNIILGVSVRVILDDMNIWIVRVKLSILSRVGGLMQFIGGPCWRKGRGREKPFSLPDWFWAGIPLVFCLWTWTYLDLNLDQDWGLLSVLALRPVNSDWNWALLGLLLHNCRSWNFSASITVWANPLTPPPLFYLREREKHKWARDRERKGQGREPQEGQRGREREVGLGLAQCGTQTHEMWDMTWAEVRCLATKPPRCLLIPYNKSLHIYKHIHNV